MAVSLKKHNFVYPDIMDDWSGRSPAVPVKHGLPKMKFLFLLIVLLFVSGYICTYVLNSNNRRSFLSTAASASVKRFGMTCFFLAVLLCFVILYIRIRY